MELGHGAIDAPTGGHSTPFHDELLLGLAGCVGYLTHRCLSLRFFIAANRQKRWWKQLIEPII